MNSWWRLLIKSGWKLPGRMNYREGAWLRTIQSFTPTFLVIFTIAANCTAATTPALSTHLTVEHGLKFLQKEAFRWKATRKCAACHHAATMMWTFNEARASGYSVDEEALKEVTAWAFGDMKTNSLTEQAPPRDVINLGWVYVLLSVETAPALKAPPVRNNEHLPEADKLADTNEDEILSARQTLLRQIASKQVSDGSWGRPLDERVPVGGPVEDIAILSRLALLQSGDNSTNVTDCINKAASWLAANHDKTSRQGGNLRLLMNTREGKPAAELNPAIASIRAEQNADGGWSQTPDMASDAYATGQALYVLARAGVKREAPEMKRGVEFLTLTQREEGSWPMTSRVNAKDLSPITAAGTAWAVLGLVRASR
jgi:squalene-hopene cyclase-like protein